MLLPSPESVCSTDSVLSRVRRRSCNLPNNNIKYETFGLYIVLNSKFLPCLSEMVGHLSSTDEAGQIY